MIQIYRKTSNLFSLRSLKATAVPMSVALVAEVATEDVTIDLQAHAVIANDILKQDSQYYIITATGEPKKLGKKDAAMIRVEK